jgi:subtilase family serine protease
MMSGTRIGLTTLAVALVLVSAPLSAVRQPQTSAADRVLPDFDVRDGRSSASPSPRTLTEMRRPAGARSSRRTRVHPHTGAVRVAEGPGLALPRGLSSGTLQPMVASLAARLGLDVGDLSELRLMRDYVSRSTRLRHVEFAQMVDGLPVFDAIVSVHVDSTGSIARMTSSAARTAGRRRNQVLAPEAAATAAALDVRPGLAFAASRTAGPSRPEGAFRFARGAFRRDLNASLTWFAMDGVLRLAWHVTVEPDSPLESYDVLIDAETGELLVRRNRVFSAEGAGRVMQSSAMNALDARQLDASPLGAGGPGGCPPPVNYSVRSLNAPFRDPATVLFDTGRLAGNNARVLRGSTLVEGALGTADGSQWSFDFPFNSADSAETALFFALNFAHDFFYDLGFDEAAGNFQVDNFGRGGLGGDSLRGNARAFGRNNANYVHGRDGNTPTINMFLFDGTGCWGQDVDNDGSADIDGDYDLDIVVHEYHHGVSLRLNTAFTGSEAGAIGEGGGDFFAYSVNNEPTLAEYARPGGLRAVNSKTYADWTCIGFFCEVHDNGEIWANLLWDTRQRFRADVVRGSEASATNEVHQLYIDALKLSPPAPTMLDMRDAMLQVDTFRNPGTPRSANFCGLWESFAGRGMGTAATDTADNGSNLVRADFSVPDGCVPQPSPAAVTVSVSAATASEAGLVHAAFTLTRDVTGPDPLVVRYGVQGTALAGTDYVRLPLTATIPAGAAEITVPVVPLDDSIVEATESVTLSLRSGGPYVIGTPFSGTVTIVSDDVLPDLTLSALTVPATGAAGASIQVTDTTLNQGSGEAAASETYYYLSRNSVLDATDTLLGSRPVPQLAPGTNHQLTLSLTLPDSLEPGGYRVFVKADGAGAVTELNEFNNVRQGLLQVGPDLVVTALTAPSTAGAGTTIAVSDTVSNPGRADAAASTTRFYLSVNGVLDSGDRLLAGRSVPALAGMTSSAGPTTVPIPADVADSTYYLIAKADGVDEVVESSETNNTRALFLRVGADLTIASFTVPARAASGATIAVADTTRNAGPGAAGASLTAFYLSVNPFLDTADTRLTSRRVDPLGPGATSARTTSIDLPGVAAGTWYVLVVADDEKTVTETQETNNAWFAAILIGPDLAGVTLAAPFNVVAGSTITLTDSVRNLGPTDAGPSVTRFYLSNNVIFDGGDTLLAARQVPALGSGLTNAGSTTVTIPSGISGTWYLFALADNTGVIAEASETNNSTLRTILISPGSN